MNLRNDIQTKAIDVNIQSSGIAEEEPISLIRATKSMKKHIKNKKTISENKHRQKQATNRKMKLHHFHKPTAGTMNNREGHFRADAKTGLEQNNDPVLRNLSAKIERKSFDKPAFTQDNRYRHYLQNIPVLKFVETFLRENTTTILDKSLSIRYSHQNSFLKSSYKHCRDTTEIIQE